jgi:putative membrane protein
MNGMGGFMFPGLGLVLLIILVIVVIGALSGGRISGGYSGRGDRSSSETPLNILKRRYARGEISREEFEQMKKDIEG